MRGKWEFCEGEEARGRIQGFFSRFWAFVPRFWDPSRGSRGSDSVLFPVSGFFSRFWDVFPPFLGISREALGILSQFLRSLPKMRRCYPSSFPGFLDPFRRVQEPFPIFFFPFLFPLFWIPPEHLKAFSPRFRGSLQKTWEFSLGFWDLS